jgi:hypothetical protein
MSISYNSKKDIIEILGLIKNIEQQNDLLGNNSWWWKVLDIDRRSLHNLDKDIEGLLIKNKIIS